MANSYQEFSQVLSDLTDEEIAWWERELKAPGDDADIDEWAEEHHIEPSEAEYYADNWPDFDYKWYKDSREIVFHSESGGGDIDNLLAMVQKFLAECRPDEYWVLEWANTCSKHRVGAFGGGAAVVTAKEQRWQSTGEFVLKTLTELGFGKKGKKS